MKRLETGVVQAGDDWPGVFIRGDNAFHYANLLSAILQEKAGALEKAQLEGLLSLLRSSDTRTKPVPQMVQLSPVASTSMDEEAK